MPEFKLHAPNKPTGDQPLAIAELVKGFQEGNQFQTLLGVTGSGKTFTMANVIQALQKPTLVIAHNKTLAASHTENSRRCSRRTQWNTLSPRVFGGKNVWYLMLFCTGKYGFCG